MAHDAFTVARSRLGNASRAGDNTAAAEARADMLRGLAERRETEARDLRNRADAITASIKAAR